jgi:hypothetical protein
LLLLFLTVRHQSQAETATHYYVFTRLLTLQIAYIVDLCLT